MNLSSIGIAKWVDHPVLMRVLTCGFFVIHMSLSIMQAEQLVLYLLYTLTIVAAGITFYRQPAWVAGAIVLLTVAIHHGFREHGMPLFAFLTMELPLSFLLMTVSRGQAKNYIHARQNTLDIVLAMSKSLDSRDPYTASHSDHVARLATEIAREMGLPKKQLESIYIGGLLHDIGKIGIPEAVLQKPSRLTDLEYQTIKSHSAKGYDILKHIPQLKDNGILDMVLHHHERYDGGGYPKGLSGEQIPLTARIMAVADSFDAMVSKRVYRERSFGLEQAIHEIEKGKGTQFDPAIADVFIGMLRSGKGLEELRIPYRQEEEEAS
ncbi:putative nucleotidyltransferase with HDIG domain [Paenibacillus phyllosphaerae]|uniref:Putative nucleotidyltransferase with HDIG domain n=1 Tax=Paenibacillus phyllosphaerae TaxID=274593 RepID=A0A7W5FL67_9BACL|nr:HD-GYP domain-containing protein [Paenibacillus phyllosphaerae]MBB3108763.1 putative nucleotidyltransferase with HDIG domain [Paenibacillus phyllosphaerae]